jgi:4a-hydroxytetrahydrobiopterin dehydratase
MTWKKANNRLKQTFTFDDFEATLAFVNDVGRLAEKANHHPTITFTYGEAVVELTTHDAGNTITEKDREIAEAIDDLLDEEQ